MRMAIDLYQSSIVLVGHILFLTSYKPLPDNAIARHINLLQRTDRHCPHGRDSPKVLQEGGGVRKLKEPVYFFIV